MPATGSASSNGSTTRVAELEEEIAALAADAPEAARLGEDLILNRLELKAAAGRRRASCRPRRPSPTAWCWTCGDTTFELYYIGGMHSASDIAILVPEHGLLMTGDTMADVWLTDTPGCLASFIARSGVRHDFPLLLENWNHLLARKDDIKTLLPGHWNGELTFAAFEARVKIRRDALGRRRAGGRRRRPAWRTCWPSYRLATRFPELVDSPGCSEWQQLLPRSWRCGPR